MAGPPAAPAQRFRLRPGDEVEVNVDDLAFGGDGVGRVEGYVVFVAGAIPGDRVRARIHKGKRAYAQGRVIALLEPSPQRLDPVADHPGAPWQVLPYERQLTVKHAQVEDALRRIGRLDGFELEPIVPAEETWRYRNKLEYSFGTGDGGELVCGFHAPGRWDRIEPMEDCLLASERSNATRRSVLAWCREAGLDAYDRRDNLGFLRNLVVREGRRTDPLSARIVTSPGDFDVESLAAAVPEADSLLWTQTESVAETTNDGETVIVAGDEAIEEELADLRFRISPTAFFQTNTEMAERLYALAGEYAAVGPHDRIFDLYCGSGTVGLTMTARAAEVWGVEIVEASVADAIENARRNGIDNAHFFAGDVRLALRELVERAGRPDLVVLDPPRAGLAKKAVNRVIEAGAPRIVYVSCNPTTLAPNAAQLVDAGYRLTRVRPVDMFPQTPHIECVALLEKSL
jgi:23S rRNA (uracil1939-C5)-methyltransferase